VSGAPRAEGPFEAVLFDAGGVLVLPDPAKVIDALAHLGASPDHADHVRGHYTGMRAVYEHSIDIDHWPAFNQAYGSEIGIAEDLLTEADAIINDMAVSDPWLWSHVNPGAPELLAALRGRGVPIGVVSNAGGQIEEVLAGLGVCQVGAGRGVEVAVVVDSTVVGVEKPDPRIFDFALDVIDVPRERVLYVGDTVRNDVLGARAAGLHPLHLDPFDLHAGAEEVWGIEPWERIRSLSEVLDRVS
jgi:putative hydrolase of the HAD superfamily